jgi:pSer/pThr/pTyr-binding forkhead associated (FHA) protein
MAKTIIDMDGSGPHISPTPPAAIPAATPPAPQTPKQAAVSGAIQDVPSGGLVTPETGKSLDKATLGPGARRVTADDVEPAPARTPLAKLVSVNRDGSDGEVHDISEESVDLGRTEGQLRFNDDPYLSERHCRFYIKNGSWIVQDLESTNGVYLRLKAAKELAHEDRLLLGKQVLCFEHLTDRERDMSPAVEHGVLIFGSPLRTPWCRMRQITVAGIARDVYHLYRSKVTIGREDGDILFPDDEFMSRRHLLLSLVNGKAMVEDLGSSNGTYVRLQGQRQLEQRDMIRIGDQLLRFEKV